MLRKLIIALALLSPLPMLAACEEESAVEQVGEGLSDAGREVEDAAD